MGGLGALCGRVSPPRGGGEALFGGFWVLSVGGGVCVVPPSVGSSPGFGLPQGVWGGSPALGKGDTPPPPDGDKSLSVGLGAL